jgi:parallel beta-helix repeat protein
MIRRRRSVIGLVGIVGAASIAAPPATAGSRLVCGQTITHSTTLKRDLTGCRGDGLVVGASGITIDLAGHAIRGVNAAGSVGIVVDGHATVTIRNGRISDFFVDGVVFRHAPRGVARGLHISRIGAGGGDGDASAGVLVDASAGVRVTGNAISNHVTAFQSDGVDVLGSAGVVVRGNRIARNAWNGVVVIQSPRSRVVRNTLDGNGNQGLEANLGSDDLVVAGNDARGNTQSGLVVGAVHGARVVGNRLARNAGSGLFMFDLADSLVAGNRAWRNAVGVELSGGQFGSHGNRLLRNRAEDNADIGILVEDGADRNRVADNHAGGNHGADSAGILVFASRGNVLAHNDASGNAGSGIGIFEDVPGTSAGNVVRRNTTNRNGGHGIDVVASTVDGGGNRAHGNATPPQCLTVACS